MDKKKKILIVILVLILIIMLGIIFLTKVEIKKRDIPVGNQNINNGANNLDKQNKEIGRIIKANGILYYDTGKANEGMLRCGNMDGNITSVTEEGKIPTEDGQANFTGAKGYQYGKENTIEVLLDNEGWVIFEAKEYSFCGVIKQVEDNVFFIEPDEGEEIRKSADLIMVGKLQIDTNVKFIVGERINVVYDGMVLETYPAQIKAIRYENIENNEYTIKVYDKSPAEYNKIHTILDKEETDKYDYSIFAYKVNVNIVINNEEISLRNALLENKINMNDIIEKANKDLEDKKINGDMYKDGGSTIYKYDNYTIIKCNTLDGVKDVYIGMPGLTINDIM